MKLDLRVVALALLAFSSVPAAAEDSSSKAARRGETPYWCETPSWDGVPSWDDILHKRPGFAKGWKYIVIHHSGGASGNAAAFDEWHTKMGYGGLAYHFVIGNGRGSGDGCVEEGFRWKEQMAGTHVTVNSWYHNIYGIGICLVGDFSVSKPTDKQMSALSELTRRLMREYGIPAESVIGHKDVQFGDIDWDANGLYLNPVPGRFEKRSCPGPNFPWTVFRAGLEAPTRRSP